MQKIKLIINADDYGMSPMFNKGILELARSGIISSTTVLIKRKHVRKIDFCDLPNISVGLHLELKEDDSVKEMETQLNKFMKIFNKTPSHLDGHQHMHLTDANLPKVIRLAKKHGLPIRSLSAADRHLIHEAGIKTPDKYISWHPKRKAKLFKNLKENKTPICEMVCHPGYYDKKSGLSYNKQRQQELNILKSREFAKIIKSYTFVNYYEF